MSKNFDYDQLEKEIFQIHNQIRKNPQCFIPKLKESLNHLREKIYHKPGEDPIQTYEGREAIEEAITFLKKQKSVRELIYDENISYACKDHVYDIGAKGLTTHEGSYGKNISDRIEKYCEWEGAIAENLDFGFKKAENIILNLLIDDGVKERYQRENLFNEEFNYCGIACGKHRDLNISCVFIYAKKLRKLGEKCNDGINYIHDYIDKTLNRKEVNNIYQENDLDAPDDTINVKVVKEVKKVEGKDKKIMKKIYLLNDTSYHVVEIEEN